MTLRNLNTLILITALGTPAAFSGAAEVATGAGARARYAAASGGLGVSDPSQVYAGDVPTFARWDAQYGGRQRRGNTCQYVYKQIRARPVSEIPVSVDLATIRRNAARAGIDPENLNRTLKAFLVNQRAIPNQHFISIVDYTKRSDQKRLFTINLRTGLVESFHTTAGRNSDRDGDGYADEFSNRNRSRQSSLGCFIAAGEYSGRHSPSLMLHGLEDTNDQACSRSVVMHPAHYVGDVPGRSNGCLALKRRDVRPVYDRVGGGGLICSYFNGKQPRKRR